MAKRSYSSCAQAASNDVEYRILSCTSYRTHDQSVPAAIARKVLRPNPLTIIEKKKQEVVMGGSAALVELILLCYIFMEEVDVGAFIFNGFISFASVLAICAYELEWTRKVRVEQFQRFQELCCEEFVPTEEYGPLYTLVDEDAQCRSFGFCYRTFNWVELPHIPQSNDRITVMLPVASSNNGLLFYTQDGNASEDVLVVNPVTGENKILGLGNGVLVQEYTDRIRRNQNSFELDEESDYEHAYHGHYNQSRLIHVLEQPDGAFYQIIMTGRAILSSGPEESEAEQRTDVYSSSTDSWTTSGDVCGNVRVAKNSNSVRYEGLILTVVDGADCTENPYLLLAYNVGLGKWSPYRRIVIPGMSLVKYQKPQIVRSNGRIFLVTFAVCPITSGASAKEEEDDPGAHRFSHQVAIYQFAPATLELKRMTDMFTYISSEAHRDFAKCVTTNGMIGVGLPDRALAYYDLRQKKWNEYPELCLEPEVDFDDEDEEEILYAGVCYKPSFTARVH